MTSQALEAARDHPQPPRSNSAIWDHLPGVARAMPEQPKRKQFPTRKTRNQFGGGALGLFKAVTSK